MLLDTTENAIPELPPEADNKTGLVKPPSRRSSPKPASAPLSEPHSSDAGATGKRDRSSGESGDDYPGVRFHVPGTNWRVAACAKGYCWLLQQRRAKDHWESRKFFATKKRLAVVLADLVGAEVAAKVKDKIDALPI